MSDQIYIQFKNMADICLETQSYKNYVRPTLPVTDILEHI